MLIKQKGAFTVELALVLMFISLLLAIHVNYALAINKKGQLDRATYSLLTVISERKQFYTSELNICGIQRSECRGEVDDIYVLAKSSMKRMIPNFDKSKFGMRLVQIDLKANNSNINVISFFRGEITDCNFSNLQELTVEQAKEILPLTTQNTRLPMYQLSLCYTTPFNIIGAIRGESMHIVSSSYSFARI